MPEKDAQLATNVLLLADLRGIDSHGLARLSGYVRLWEKNRINATAQPKIVRETLSTATVCWRIRTINRLPEFIPLIWFPIRLTVKHTCSK